MTPAVGGSERTVELLLVDDNPGDARLMKEAFAEARLAVNLHVARDGVEALDFLRRRGLFEHVPTPDLVLLDLNLPRKDGREVLSDMKEDRALRRIPVIVLSTSSAEQDVAASYDLSANAYIVKPVDLGGFLDVIRSIESFWLTIARLPNAS